MIQYTFLFRAFSTGFWFGTENPTCPIPFPCCVKKKFILAFIEISILILVHLYIKTDLLLLWLPSHPLAFLPVPTPTPVTWRAVTPVLREKTSASSPERHLYCWTWEKTRCWMMNKVFIKASVTLVQTSNFHVRIIVYDINTNVLCQIFTRCWSAAASETINESVRYSAYIRVIFCASWIAEEQKISGKYVTLTGQRLKTFSVCFTSGKSMTWETKCNAA